MQITQANLSETEDQLSDLAAKRTSASFEMGIELVECGVITGPVNLPERLRTGGIAALLTLLIVGFAQWWSNRPANGTRQ